MVKQKEIKEIRKAKKMLDHKLKAILKEKLLEILGDNDLDNGFTLVELSGRVLNKAYITENDKKEVYQIIKEQIIDLTNIQFWFIIDTIFFYIWSCN